MASPQHPAGTPSPTSRPGPSGMSQGTYTGNVSFSRGNTDLISAGAALPSGSPQAPAPTPKPVSPPPPAHHFMNTGVTFTQ